MFWRIFNALSTRSQIGLRNYFPHQILPKIIQRSGIRFIVNGVPSSFRMFFVSSILIFIVVEKSDYSKIISVINQSAFLSIR